MSMTRFIGKNVVVTGAGSGMGRATALRIAREGAHLILVGRRAEPLETLRQEIIGAGGQATAIAADVADEAAMAAFGTKLAAEFGHIDGLFANAGALGELKLLADAQVADFDAVYHTNVRGTFLTIQQCLPLMEGGAILINASWTVGGVMPAVGAYASSKGALLALMRTLAVEQGSRGIRVNAINPGIIRTPMADALTPEVAVKLAAHTPLQRNGVPEDIAGPVAWLLSDDAAFVTGQEITVDGGFTLGGIRL